MQAFQDQLNRTIYLKHRPTRIVSLVPSQTELLYDLGLDHEIVGITDYCVRPKHWKYPKSKLGGTKKLHLPAIHKLNPDLIIANKEENDKEQIEALVGHYPVWISDIRHIADACQMIETVAVITGKQEIARNMIGEIRKSFEQLARLKKTRKEAAYFIWRKPYMVAGGDTFISAMMDYCGFNNYFTHHSRYPIVSDVHSLAGCEVILLSSEPFPFQQKHIEELSFFLPTAKFKLVDGEMFSWYGSRLLQAPAYFRKLIKEMQQ
ncbi:MAG: cobalamin-binding protein [Bacteroidetes bacterium]|nr:MAG: cobalamin-binding protein [Bacteroidota bacterium]